ncbi:phage major capsid protein, P2 family [Qipengyuania flava]|uniref:phage major capsid protein, P2 family n=1 Tax=Qipengyuania flava TaxID=192812 RepID=UPI00273E7D6D|nr:phage major capsid protein, P2 family [Qipengyuania flava]
MAYNLSDRGRQALETYYQNVERANGASRGVHSQFAVDPTAEQRLEDMQREEVAFMGLINVFGVRDMIGQPIGLSTEDFIASRTSEANLPRKPKNPLNLTAREYRLVDTEFDTKLPWQVIDNWARFPDFAERYARHVARSVALSRMSIGFNGVSIAADSDPVANPNGEDMNIGWLQKMRLEKPAHVMGRALDGNGHAVGAAAPIYIGPNSDIAQGDYKSIDALAYDLISGMPSWARNSTSLRVIVGADLVDEKYFPMINRPLATTVDGGRSTTDEIVGGIIESTKQIGGRPALIVPKFPADTIMVTPLENLSLYYQEGSRRRYIRDEPENKSSLVDYNSANEGYVIEDTDFAVQAENITFGDRV